MTEQIGKRCTQFVLLAMLLAIGMGLIAWGPIPWPGTSHSEALPHLQAAAHAWSSLALVLASLWAWHALQRSHWPEPLCFSWQAGCALMALSAVTGIVEQELPGVWTHLAAEASTLLAVLLFVMGFLAERMHPAFGSARAATATLAAVALVTVASGLSMLGAQDIDMRPLIWLRVAPLLLLPAGATCLPGRYTTGPDWRLMIGVYGAGSLCELWETLGSPLGGLLNGETLMQLCLTFVVCWLAHRASSAAASATQAAADIAQHSTSLNTSS